MREDIREIIVEMFDTDASIKRGGIDIAVAKIEALYKKKYKTADEDLKKLMKPDLRGKEKEVEEDILAGENIRSNI